LTIGPQVRNLPHIGLYFFGWGMSLRMR
jgi:hypothetical protein